MASSSVIMLSNVSMERLYLSQPPAWTDLQRLPFSLNQQQPDARASQQMIRTCYDKLLHHMYDINSSATATINQINEQLELAAEYCQLKTFSNSNTVYLHSDQFYVEVKFDPSAPSPISVSICFTFEQQNNEERFTCPRMLKALTDKQYKLFREHLNGYASLFTLTAPNMNNDKGIGYTAYKILQQDLERLADIDAYKKLLEGFQQMCEGLPMLVKLNDQLNNNSLLPTNVRIIMVSSTNQYSLPIQSSIYLDEKTDTVQFDTSLKTHRLATGHFALEFDENQSPFTLLLSYAQEISHLTNINTLVSNAKTFNYLSTVLPKTKSFQQYQWYISHDQSAVSIRRIPFTNLKQLIHILNLIRQQIYLTKYLNYYFNNNYDQDNDHMDDDNHNDIFLELSLLSSTILSITSAQSHHLSTFILQMSNINTSPLLINRKQQKEIYLTSEQGSLLKLIEQLLQEDNTNQYSLSSNVDFEPKTQSEEQKNQLINLPKINRRLSCGPPAKPTWRRATALRRIQPACLTLVPADQNQEKIDDKQLIDDNDDDDISQSLMSKEGDNEEKDCIFPLNEPSTHAQLVPKPSLSIFPSTLSRCTSVSSTQSVSTPPIFGLSPSTPYPGAKTNPNGNVFFPLGKQVSVPEYSPVSSPIIGGSFDPFAFLPTNTPTPSNLMAPNESGIKPQQKKKRRRSDHSADNFMQTINANPNDKGSPMQTAKVPTSGGDASTAKRGKKLTDKNSQQSQQLIRPKSAFKVTDSPTANLLSQQSLTSSEDSQSDLKPLKVVIKRVGDSGSASNDESQQQSIKQRKKQQQQIQQQQMGNTSGSIPPGMRKVPIANTPSGSSPSLMIKTEHIDMTQLNADSNVSALMNMNDGTQRERPRPNSSLSNSSTSLTSSQPPRSAVPQPPIVLKIQRSKVYPGQDQSSSSSTTTTTATSSTVTTSASNNIPSALKEALKQRARSIPTAPNNNNNNNNNNKQHVTSPPLLAAKLTSPSATTTNNPLAPPTSVNSLFRIPRKSSSQEVTAKPKTEPTPPASTSSSPILSKSPLLPTPGVRPSPPPSQIGSWQSPPTQQPSRFHQNRPRSSWSQQQAPRGRAPITSPNMTSLNSGHSSTPNFSQQPRSILKKSSSNEGSTSDLLYMSSSELPGLNEQRSGANFAAPLPPPSRTATSPGMYDDNDDDSSPQAHLVIDTSSSSTANVLLPYTIVPGSNSSSIDNYDPMHENNSMINSSQQQNIGDDSLSNLD